MTEPPKKIIHSMDLYSGGGTGDFTQELPIEWDILVAASDRCLMGRVRGFVEREIVRETPASCLWRLWNYELGEFGIFEVRKIRPGWSQVTFSGLDFKGLESDERWEIKKRHMRDVIDAYYFLLAQEDIYPPKTEIPTNAEQAAMPAEGPYNGTEMPAEATQEGPSGKNIQKIKDNCPVHGSSAWLEHKKIWQQVRELSDKGFTAPAIQKKLIENKKINYPIKKIRQCIKEGRMELLVSLPGD